MTRKNLIITLTTLGFAVLCDAHAAPQRSRSRSSVRRTVSKRPTSKSFATQPTVSINTLKQLITLAKKKGWWSDDEAKNMVQGLSAVSQPEDFRTIRRNLNMLVQKTIPENQAKDTIARIKAVLNKSAPVDARADQAQQNQTPQDKIKELQDTIDQLTKNDIEHKETIDQLTKAKEQWTQQEGLAKKLKDAESEAKDSKDKIKQLQGEIEDLAVLQESALGERATDYLESVTDEADARNVGKLQTLLGDLPIYTWDGSTLTVKTGSNSKTVKKSNGPGPANAASALGMLTNGEFIFIKDSKLGEKMHKHEQ